MKTLQFSSLLQTTASARALAQEALATLDRLDRKTIGYMPLRLRVKAVSL